MRKLILVVFLGLFMTGIALLMLQPKWYLKNDRYKMDRNLTQQLEKLGDSALQTLDVPVAAVLLYDSAIFSTGYNTVRRDNMAGGHAEINAISNALKKIGIDSFMKLDRKKLRLITTWEPCYMCQGAIVEYNIMHVVVVKPKSLKHWLMQWKRKVHYELNKQVSDNDTLQEYLFKKHPLYNKQKVNI